jgi:transposase-like protein
MESITRRRGLGKKKILEHRQALEQLQELGGIDDVDIKVSLIQGLIPIALKEVSALLQAEVKKLAGEKQKHGKDCVRWGGQGGSIYLGGQKVPIRVLRVRDKVADSEVPLENYHKLQNSGQADERIFVQLLNGLSTHKYEESAALAPQVLGLSASSVSKRFRRQSAKQLENLMERDLGGYDFVAMFIDGKAFAKDGLVVALGVTIDGEKIILGIEQMNSESSQAIGQFIDKLIARGLRYEQGLLVIVDGSKGIISGVEKKLNGYALIQRCRQHKKENVAGYLPKSEQKLMKIKMTQAYALERYDEAEAALENIARELDTRNPSAAASLREGMSDTLTLQRLGLNRNLTRSFSNTNVIESVQSQIGQYTDKVDRWRNGRHIQEWTASALVRIEPRLNKINGWRALSKLREALRGELKLDQKIESNKDAELVGAGA